MFTLKIVEGGQTITETYDDLERANARFEELLNSRGYDELELCEGDSTRRVWHREWPEFINLYDLDDDEDWDEDEFYDPAEEIEILEQALLEARTGDGAPKFTGEADDADPGA